MDNQAEISQFHLNMQHIRMENAQAERGFEVHRDHTDGTRMDAIGNMLEANHHRILIKHAMFYTTLDGNRAGTCQQTGCRTN